eukprot:TRINITY_DN10550_c0_g1_i7.p1 TRINITY_DN10550_c0_g1~~TRINITY_DN10550_c0_g1_i7.p1  ORF type:complete len:256 (-),score=60.72 TRINITY_DN10550_c0_g1_i7:313-1080(-)
MLRKVPWIPRHQLRKRALPLISQSVEIKSTSPDEQICAGTQGQSECGGEEKATPPDVEMKDAKESSLETSQSGEKKSTSPDNQLFAGTQGQSECGGGEKATPPDVKMKDATESSLDTSQSVEKKSTSPDSDEQICAGTQGQSECGGGEKGTPPDVEMKDATGSSLDTSKSELYISCETDMSESDVSYADLDSPKSASMPQSPRSNEATKPDNVQDPPRSLFEGVGESELNNDLLSFLDMTEEVEEQDRAEEDQGT